jgi:hypothetical protein
MKIHIPLLVTILAIFGSAAVAQPTQVMSQPGAQLEAWHKAMSRTPLPRQGCFESDYPSTGWREVSCMTATPLLDLPARGPRLYTVGRDRLLGSRVGPHILGDRVFPECHGCHE